MLHDSRQSFVGDLPLIYVKGLWEELPYVILLLILCTGVELFTILTFLCCAAILPVNLVVGPTILLDPEPGTPY